MISSALRFNKVKTELTILKAVKTDVGIVNPEVVGTILVLRSS